MKKYFVILTFLSLLLPNVTLAERKIPIIIEGVIGDYAKKARVYEIDGKIYHFKKGIKIENLYGKRLRFKHLKGGRYIKIIGEKIVGDDSKERIQYHKIIIIK